MADGNGNNIPFRIPAGVGERAGENNKVRDIAAEAAAKGGTTEAVNQLKRVGVTITPAVERQVFIILCATICAGWDLGMIAAELELAAAVEERLATQGEVN